MWTESKHGKSCFDSVTFLRKTLNFPVIGNEKHSRECPQPSSSLTFTWKHHLNPETQFQVSLICVKSDDGEGFSTNVCYYLRLPDPLCACKRLGKSSPCHRGVGKDLIRQLPDPGRKKKERDHPGPRCC